MLFQRHLSKRQKKSKTREILLFDSLTGRWILWEFSISVVVWSYLAQTWLLGIPYLLFVFSTICVWL